MPDEQARQPIALINPEIVAAQHELATREEGCLSLPGQYAEVTRPARVKVRYLDADRRAAGDRGRGAAVGLPAARDRPSGRRPVRRSPLGAEAQHDHAPAGQGAAAEERGRSRRGDAPRLHGQPGLRRAGAAGAARAPGTRSPRSIASRRARPGAARRCGAARCIVAADALGLEVRTPARLRSDADGAGGVRRAGAGCRGGRRPTG